jgi:hypothetical protein
MVDYVIYNVNGDVGSISEPAKHQKCQIPKERIEKKQKIIIKSRGCRLKSQSGAM